MGPIRPHRRTCVVWYPQLLTIVYKNRYEKEFDQVQDVFELQVWITVWLWCLNAAKANEDVLPSQRNLNNAFAYDLVPSPSVITAALKAARRVNDFPTAVRIFEGTSRVVFG